MAINPATAWNDLMTNVTGNVGGALQTLNPVTTMGGRERVQIGRLTLASQVSGTFIHIGRVPVGAALLGITVLTDTSLGSSTLAFGDAASGNAAIYGAAATLTATNTPTSWAKAATYGVPIVHGYDGVTGTETTYANNSGYGGGYEDILMSVGAATMPSSGNLVTIVHYTID
ncbi:MAG TPA: hypothetical protein VGG48_01885 [Rhizomicrobium sp.]|jgi:hypothetical protein